MKPTLPVIFLLFLCLWLFTAAAVEMRAATLTVTKIEDTNDGVCDADCSLREAVAASASGDTVVFSPLFNTPQTITLTLGQINIDKNLTITGTGSNLVTVSANLAGRVFYIFGTFNITMSGMKLRDGRVGVDSNDARGGAILFLIEPGTGNLNLSNMEFTNNAAFYPPDPQARGAAVYCYGCTMTVANLNLHHNLGPGNAAAIDSDSSVVTITDSIMNNNIAGATGRTLSIQNSAVTNNLIGGISGQHITLVDSTITNNNGRGVFGGSGGSTMTVENCTISQNTDGGLSNVGFAVIRNTQINNNQKSSGGAGVTNFGTMYIYNSAITGNTAGPQGGGIYNSTGQLFLVNSTVSGNFAGTAISTGMGGGIYGQVDEANPNGHVFLINSTVSNNQSSGLGGGVRQDTQGTATIRNTIIAGNTSTQTIEEDVSGVFTSQGTNLIGNANGSSGWIAGDLLNVNPMLGPLADNGGSTMTHALLPGSPAINAGNNAVAIDPQTQLPLTVDQRGFLRFYSGTVDIGAFEVQPVIAGTITYGNATGLQTPRFVSGVLLSAVGSPNVTATSRADGTYTIGGFGNGAYTVTPSKTGGANGISSFDAGLIAKHVAGLQSLTGNQLIVADVSGNGTLSSFDAGEVARYAVGVSGFGTSGNWIFVPANRTYSSVNSTVAGEDFVALLMGDVSGNWVNQ